MRKYLILPLLFALVGCDNLQVKHPDKEAEQFGYNSARAGFTLSDNPYSTNPEMADWMKGFVRFNNEGGMKPKPDNNEPRPAPHRKCNCGQNCRCCNGCSCGGKHDDRGATPVGENKVEVKEEKK